MSKHVIEGYIGKDSVIKEIFRWVKEMTGLRWFEVRSVEIWSAKGSKGSWDKDAWPPKKIRITIEEID